MEALDPKRASLGEQAYCSGSWASKLIGTTRQPCPLGRLVGYHRAPFMRADRKSVNNLFLAGCIVVDDQTT